MRVGVDPDGAAPAGADRSGTRPWMIRALFVASCPCPAPFVLYAAPGLLIPAA